MSEYSVTTKFIDLAAQQQLIRSQLDMAIQRVLDHGQYIMGPEVTNFEENLRQFTGAKHALTCANGTDALTLVLMAWGIGPGDAVFVPSFGYVATGESPAQLGATPFFVDVHENTFNIDPESFKQAIIDCREIGLKPAVVIPVDLFGQPSDVDSISEIAHQEGIKVLVDGAQSFGATSMERRVGTMGDATTTSFFPAKPLGCYGDGGAVFTNNDEDAHLINSIRLHGKGTEKYDNVRVGLNSRLDTIQAAILIEKLKIFPDELISRNRVAKNYRKSETENGPIHPTVKDGLVSAWAQYTLRVNKRDEFANSLKAAGVPSVIYYPKPLTMQDGYSNFPVVTGGTPVSHSLVENVLSLPMHPYMKSEQQNEIIQILIDITKNQ